MKRVLTYLAFAFFCLLCTATNSHAQTVELDCPTGYMRGTGFVVPDVATGGVRYPVCSSKDGDILWQSSVALKFVGPPTGICLGTSMAEDTSAGVLYICQNGSWVVVSGGGGGSLTISNTQVAYGNGTNSATGDPNFTWLTANKKLLVGDAIGGLSGSTSIPTGAWGIQSIHHNTSTAVNDTGVLGIVQADNGVDSSSNHIYGGYFSANALTNIYSTINGFGSIAGVRAEAVMSHTTGNQNLATGVMGTGTNISTGTVGDLSGIVGHAVVSGNGAVGYAFGIRAQDTLVTGTIPPAQGGGIAINNQNGSALNYQLLLFNTNEDSTHWAINTGKGRSQFGWALNDAGFLASTAMPPGGQNGGLFQLQAAMRNIQTTPQAATVVGVIQAESAVDSVNNHVYGGFFSANALTNLYSGTGGTVGSLAGVLSYGKSSHATGNQAGIMGGNFWGENTSTGTVSEIEGVAASAFTTGNGLAATAFGIKVYGYANSGSTPATQGGGILIKGTTPGSQNAVSTYGLLVGDYVQAANFWAIKTGTGLNEFGDTVQLDANLHGIKSTAPTCTANTGNIWYDTTTNTWRFCNGSGAANDIGAGANSNNALFTSSGFTTGPADTTLDTLYDYILPGGSLGATGGFQLDFNIDATTVSSGQSIQVRFSIAGISFFLITMQPPGDAVQMSIRFVNATNTTNSFSIGGMGVNGGSVTGISSNQTGLTVDTTIAQHIQIQAQKTLSTDTIKIVNGVIRRF